MIIRSQENNVQGGGGVDSENLFHCPQAPVLWSRMASAYAEQRHGGSDAKSCQQHLSWMIDDLIIDYFSLAKIADNRD